MRSLLSTSIVLAALAVMLAIPGQASAISPSSCRSYEMSTLRTIESCGDHVGGGMYAAVGRITSRIGGFPDGFQIAVTYQRIGSPARYPTVCTIRGYTTDYSCATSVPSSQVGVFVLAYVAYRTNASMPWSYPLRSAAPLQLG